MARNAGKEFNYVTTCDYGVAVKKHVFKLQRGVYAQIEKLYLPYIILILFILTYVFRHFFIIDSLLNVSTGRVAFLIRLIGAPFRYQGSS